MGYAQERIDIESRLSANWSTTDIAWGDGKFIPTAGTAWIRCTILPGSCESLEFGRDTEKEYLGIIDIGIFIPKENVNAKNLATIYTDTLAAIFDMRKFGTVDCDEAYAQNLGIEDGWYHWSITIPFKRIE